MKTLLRQVLWIFCAVPLWAGVVPSQITYQGTLKQGGVAANGTYTMTFQITDLAGAHQYWSSGPTQILVNQGLFSTVLSPSGVDWQNVTPFVEVHVNGQVLLPREPVTANSYALMCADVVDNAITTSKIAKGAITADLLSPGTISHEQIAMGSITSDLIADSAVTAAKLGQGVVGSAQLANASVTTPILADGSVTSKKLDPGLQNIFVPAGIIVEYAGPNPPAGWMLCNGAAVSRTTYASLFQSIGTVWGGGDGVSTFNLPDLRGRAPVGAGQGTGLSNRSLAQVLGEETHLLSIDEIPSHNHGVSDPGHSHGLAVPFVASAGGAGIGVPSGPGASTSTSNTKTGLTIQNSGGGNAHNNMQPSAIVNFIIKY
jgi:microcystin-dependent protein